MRNLSYRSTRLSSGLVVASPDLPDLRARERHFMPPFASLSGGGGSILRFATAEIGNVTIYTVAVALSGVVLSPGSNFALGVTIQKSTDNGATWVTQTISTATRQSDLKTIYYALIAPVVFGNLLTWSYDATVGDLTDGNATVLPSVAAQAVTNNVPGVPWYFVNTTDRVSIGGFPAASFGNSNWSNGYTHINKTGQYRIRQDGKVYRIVTKNSKSTGGTGKFKVFRLNGATYDFAAEESLTIPASAGPNTIDLTGVPCAMADSPGFYAAANSCLYATTTEHAGFETGDITASNAFATNDAGITFDIECWGMPPFLAATGDSLCQGVSNNPAWNPVSLTGTITGETWHQLRGLVDATDGAGFQYQNKGTGGTWALGASSGAAACAATKAKVVLFHYGVNDLATGRTWDDIAADMATCKAALAAGQDMWVDEIIPWNNGSDGQAATLRTWNANYASWCAANGAHLIAMHDAMGQVRGSTGELDDIKTGYGAGDGVHLSQTGVDAMAAIYESALENYYG